MAKATSPDTLTFRYWARNPNHSVIKGKIKAPSEDTALRHLTNQKLVPLKIEKIESTGLNAEINIQIGGRVKLKDVSVWARNFSTMFEAGLPVAKILDVLQSQTENQKLADITGEIHDSVNSGSTLAEALDPHKDTFTPMVVSMIAAGEESGEIQSTMKRVSDSLESSVRLQQVIKSALTYPVAIMIIAALLLTGMLLFIVPIFDELFQELGGELPLPTQILVFISGIIKIAIIPIIISIIAFITWWRKNKNKAWLRNIVDPLKLKLPVFGKLFQLVAVSRFTRNLSTLLASGVALTKALEIVKPTVGSVIVEQAVDDVKDSVSVGKTFAGPLAEHKIFPPMVVQMATIGEEAGDIPTMMDKISDMYDSEVEAMSASLASLIEPLMIAILGVVIGSMVISLYLPMFSIYDQIG